MRRAHIVPLRHLVGGASTRGLPWRPGIASAPRPAAGDRCAPPDARMGIGGSTASRPGSAESALVVGQQPPRPGGSACCPHFRRNHAPADRSSLDRDIDEIVAAVDQDPDTRPTQQEDVPEVNYKELEDLNHMEDPPQVDYAKFKNLNHKGSTIAPSGRLIQHQESDLLWRLGLVSPEAYKMSPGPRSAPSSQGPCLKTPSYDLTEEQLMATIEKEFEVAISPHR